MRAIATGDWHSGARSLSLDDQEPVWHRIVDVAIEQRADLFLHAGDAFDGPTVSMDELAAIRRPFNRLRSAGIPILIVRGNSTHDLATRPVDALDLFGDYQGITVSTMPELHALAGVAVCTLPWVSPARLVAQENGEVDHDHLNSVVARMLVDIASGLEERARREHPGLPTILLGHWSVSGSSLPSGLPVDQLREPVLEIADLEALGFDAIILGHIHKAQVISADPWSGYVGSPQPLNHGEENDAHGVWLLDIDAENGGRSTFVPIGSRRFVTIDVGDLTHSGDPFGWIQQTYERVETEDAIVRVRYQLTEAQARLFTQNLIRDPIMEAGAYRVSVEPQIVRAARARAEALHGDLSPLEALRLYCGAQGVEARLAERMDERLREWVEA